MAKVIRDAMDQIKIILTGLTVTEPEAATLEHVYEPPIAATALDYPSVILKPPGLPKNDGPSGGLAMLQYAVPLRVVVQEENAEESADFAVSWAEAVRKAFLPKQDLNGTCDGILGPTYEPPAGWSIGGKKFTIVDMELRVNIEEIATYGV